MFDLEKFVEECRHAAAAESSPRAVREIVARAVAEPAGLIRRLGEPTRAGLHAIHRSAGLTVLNVVWAPLMMAIPHNHRMWAVIGVYTGREDNIFWRRLPDYPGKVEAAAAKALSEKDTDLLGRDIIHSVANPIPRLTGAIHVYGGDFFDPAGRSEWDPETLAERPWDIAASRRRFEEAEAAWARLDGRVSGGP